MSIARHHNEWLSLIEISGPFLSLPVLMRVFPQGLEAIDRDGLTELRLAYDEWLDDQNSLRPSPAIHSVWARYVLEHVLGFEKSNLLESQAIPATLNAFIAEQAETLRPDLVIVSGDPSIPKPRMLVQVYPFTQGLEKSMQNHHWKASPAMRMLELLRATGVSLGMVTNGEQWMLVNAPKGETSAFITWYAALWLEEQLTLRAFSSLLGAYRFFSVAEEDTLESMLKDSINEQQEVTDQLGYQVRSAVEVLIRAIDKADQDRGRALLKDFPESDLYEAALTVMMRLVFLFSAEERGLLLLGDPLYDQNYAVSTLRVQLRETADQQGEEVLERRFDAWCRLLAIFRAVHDGIHHDRLNLPGYGGSLFDPKRYPFLEGRTSQSRSEREMLPISNRTVLHLLEALQVLRVKVPGGGPAEARRLSFRSLDVEQIGHVYEGLLDHQAVRAKEPVLGLAGTRDKEPEIPLSTLLGEEAKGEKSFLAYLKEQTGRSENALSKALQEEPDVFAGQHLQIACNNDAKVYKQVVRFAGLIREDDFGYPAVYIADSVYMTAGATRRATGTHYTPRSLTEPIVQHTLEPLVYTGPAEGLSKEEWKLKSPAELLELKVCDMAMGSAGFLVQVIRYLSERLVEAWEQTSISLKEFGVQEGGQMGEGKYIQITPEGQPASGKPGEMIIPQDDEERLILARRLVADRCIYGVDKNPLAVEIAKLSIWLTTMDKGRPFSFLDHALKCGDSLVGADEEMYRNWAYSLKGAQYTLYLSTLEELVATARQKRRELESFTVLDVRDTEHKANLLREADEAMARVKLGCDLLVGARLLGLKAAELETLLSHLLWDYVAGLPMDTPDASRVLKAARKEHAFHWQFEFPEVFEKGGFIAIIGNPPFLSAQSITSIFGNQYRQFIQNNVSCGQKGTADLCAYFLRRSSSNIDINGMVGFICTSTIKEGNTREIGLTNILANGNKIIRAVSSSKWPGEAQLLISIIWIIKGYWEGPYILDEKEVAGISDFLLPSENIVGKPNKLHSNSGKAFQGSIPLGKGFLLTENEAFSLIQKNIKNKEVLFPFLNGDDVSTRPNQLPDRWVIYFFDWPIERAQEFSEIFHIVKTKVKPERDKNKDYQRRVYWWRFTRPTLELYRSIKNEINVLVCSEVTKFLPFVFVPNGYIYSSNLDVFTPCTYANFAVLQSVFHEIWSRLYCSTLGTTLKYSTGNSFETFPFPLNTDELEFIGTKYYEVRQEILINRNLGLTDFYNEFHDPKLNIIEITEIRKLHRELDITVSSSYNWDDLNLDHGFHETPQGVRFTISEEARREVLARLLKLNHERYEEELKAGLHEKNGVKHKAAKYEREKTEPKRLKEQPSLLYEAESEASMETQVEAPVATPADQIGGWDQVVCLGCGKHLVGFSVEEHTKSAHQGKDPGYRKMRG
jgi:hypothetical protein